MREPRQALLDTLERMVREAEGFVDGPPTFDHIEQHADRLDAAWDALPRLIALARTALVPIPMVLHCPLCGLQHIDAPEPGKCWDNPPHRSHLCHNCGCIWRPADVPTCGVARTATLGSADSWVPEDAHADIVGYIDLCLTGFLNDPPGSDHQRGFLSALLILWREALHRDGGEERLTKLADMARADQPHRQPLLGGTEHG